MQPPLSSISQAQHQACQLSKLHADKPISTTKVKCNHPCLLSLMLSTKCVSSANCMLTNPSAPQKSNARLASPALTLACQQLAPTWPDLQHNQTKSNVSHFQPPPSSSAPAPHPAPPALQSPAGGSVSVAWVQGPSGSAPAPAVGMPAPGPPGPSGWLGNGHGRCRGFPQGDRHHHCSVAAEDQRIGSGSFLWDRDFMRQSSLHRDNKVVL